MNSGKKLLYKMRDILNKVNIKKLSSKIISDYDQGIYITSYYNSNNDRHRIKPMSYGYVIVNSKRSYFEMKVTNNEDQLFLNLSALYESLSEVRPHGILLLRIQNKDLRNILLGQDIKIKVKDNKLFRKCLTRLQSFKQVLVGSINDQFNTYQHLVSNMTNQNIYDQYIAKCLRQNRRSNRNLITKSYHRLTYVPIPSLPFIPEQAVQLYLDNNYSKAIYKIKHHQKSLISHKTYSCKDFHYLLLKSFINCLDHEAKQYKAKPIIIITKSKWLYDLMTDEAKLKYYAWNYGCYANRHKVNYYDLMRYLILLLKQYQRVFIHYKQTKEALVKVDRG